MNSDIKVSMKIKVIRTNGNVEEFDVPAQMTAEGEQFFGNSLNQHGQKPA